VRKNHALRVGSRSRREDNNRGHRGIETDVRGSRRLCRDGLLELVQEVHREPHAFESQISAGEQDLWRRLLGEAPHAVLGTRRIDRYENRSQQQRAQEQFHPFGSVGRYDHHTIAALDANRIKKVRDTIRAVAQVAVRQTLHLEKGATGESQVVAEAAKVLDVLAKVRCAHLGNYRVIREK